MAVLDDLSQLIFLCTKAINVIEASSITTIQLTPESDREGETSITITPDQKATLDVRMTGILDKIRTIAGGLK